ADEWTTLYQYALEHDPVAAGQMDGYLEGRIGTGLIGSVILSKAAVDVVQKIAKLKYAGKGTTGNSSIGELAVITQKQLDKKFKHAEDFGIITTKKNADTLSQYETAIKNHMEDIVTKSQGTYGFVKDSKVFFNSKTNN